MTERKLEARIRIGEWDNCGAAPKFLTNAQSATVRIGLTAFDDMLSWSPDPIDAVLRDRLAEVLKLIALDVIDANTAKPKH